MIIRSIDEVGDWNFGKGRNDYVSNNKAVAQDINCRLLEFLGDCFFAIDSGIDWFNLLGSKNEMALKLAVSNVITNTENVDSVVVLSTFYDSSIRKKIIYYKVTTAFGTVIESTTEIPTNFLLTQAGDPLITQGGDNINI